MKKTASGISFSFRKSINISDLLFFLSLWWFHSIVLGSFYYYLQELSFFTLNNTIMQPVLSKPFGILFWIGRLLLTVFLSPFWGGFMLSAGHLLITRSIGSIFHIPTTLFSLRYLPSLLLCFCLLPNVSISGYHLDISFPIALWAVLVLGCLIVSPLVHWFVRRKKEKEPATPSLKIIGVNTFVILFCWIALWLFIRPNTILAEADMMRSLDKQEWEEIIERAGRVERPNRTMMVLRSVALLHTNRMGAELFDANFDFRDEQILHGSTTAELAFYQSIAAYHSGLTYTGYHWAMDYLTTQGVSNFTLKLLAKSALLNEDYKVAEKYLHLLEEAPFQNQFTNRYTSYLVKPELMQKDAELNSITELLPVENSLEYQYNTPTFLWYYTQLKRGRTKRSLYISLDATLYVKDMDGFIARCEMLRQERFIPRYYQEGIIFYALRANRQLLKQFSLSETYINNIAASLNYIDTIDKPTAEHRKIFLERFGRNYVYYMYFQNIPNEHS